MSGGGNITPINAKAQLPAVASAGVAAAMPPKKADALDRRMQNFRGVLRALKDGASDAAAAELFVAETGKSRATAYRWIAAYRQGGIDAMAPKHAGRQRKPREWDVRAQYLLTLPSRPNCGEVAARLRAEGFADASADQVRALWRSLPSNKAETSVNRIGKHYHKLNETPYVVRDWSHVPVGYLYELDGHCCDFYIEHPKTGGYFRPEITFIIDVRSRFIVDFWVGGFENSTDLRWAVSRACLAWDHVPHEIHVDPGAFKSRAMVDPVSGWCAKMDIDVHFALPGNARGKGLVEGEFRIFEGRFGKFMPTYLHNRTDDEMRLFADKWKAKKVPRYTVHQLCELIQRDYVNPRRSEPRDALDGKSPAELWAGLTRNPVMAPASAVVRPRVNPVVRNGRVQLHSRIYQLDRAAREQTEDRRVIVEYDDHHDQSVWVYLPNGEYLGQAQLVSKRPGIPESRVAEKLAKTAAGQIKRLQLKRSEVEARAIADVDGLVIDSDASPVHALPGAVERLALGHSFGRPAPAPPINPDGLSTQHDGDDSSWDANWDAIKEQARANFADGL